MVSWERLSPPPRQLELKVSREQLREALAEMLAEPETRRLIAQSVLQPIGIRGGSPEMPAAEVSSPGPFGASCSPPGGDYSFPANLAIAGKAAIGVTPGTGSKVTVKDTAGVDTPQIQLTNTYYGSPADRLAGLFLNLPDDPVAGTNRRGYLAMGYSDYTHAYPLWDKVFKGVALASVWQDLNLAADGGKVQIWSGSTPVSPTVVVIGSNVGIGTTGPETPLMLVKANSGSGALTPVLKVQTDGASGEGPMVKFAATLAQNVAKGFIAYQSTGGGYGGNGKLLLGVNPATDTTDVSASDAKVAIQGDGKVGIGTTAPAERLDVAGKMRASGDHPILIDPTTGGVQLPDMDPPGDLYAAPKQYVDNRVAGTFNVKQFGATGDGTTDDTDAIQDAIGAAHDADGGVVLFPPGTYLVTNPDPNPEKRALQGLSKIGLWGAGAGATVIRFKPGSSGNMLKFDGESNFSIRNIQWDWNSVGRDQGPILVTASSFFDITDCSFVNLGGPPIYPPPPPAPQPAHWGIHVVGSVVDSQDFCHDFRIERNYFKLPEPFGNTQNNALLAGRANGVINANHCDGSGIIVSGHDLKITNNVIHGFQYGGGITVSGTTAPEHDSWNIEVIGNTVYEGTGKDKDQAWCAGIENWARDSIITANVCHGNAGNGIGNAGLRCIVSDNTCYDNGNGGPGVNPDHYGITIFYHTDPDKSMYNASRSVYSGNACFDTRPDSQKTQWYGIGDETGPTPDTGYCSNVRVGANNLFGNKNEDLRLRGSNYLVEVTSASGTADFPSLKIGGTEVITNGRVLQNVELNPSSLQIGGTEVISDQLDLHNVTASAAIINSDQFAAARIPDLGASKITTGQFTAARIPELDGSKITTGSISVPGSVSGGSLKVGETEVVNAGRNVGNIGDINNSGYIHSGGVGNFDDGVEVNSGTVITSTRGIIHRYFAQEGQPTLENNELAVWWDTDGGAVYLVFQTGGVYRKVQIV